MVDAVSLLVALIAAVAAVYAFFALARGGAAPKSPGAGDRRGEESEADGGGAPPRAAQTEQSSPKKQAKKKKAPPRISKPSAHPRYVRRFGGHHGNILAVCPSPTGEWMATSGADGLLRVARVERDGKGGPDAYLLAKIEDDDGVPDRVRALSWEADGRTVACALDRSSEVRFYRMRKKKKDLADPSCDAHPYELAELVKRRFPTSARTGDVTACEADTSSSNFHLVLTSGDSKAHGGQKTAVAWDGKTGDCLGEVTTGGGDVRLSRDGKFLCGRGAGGTDQIKVFEVVKKKVKGEIEPLFDRIPHAKVMTLVAGVKVVDVTFGYDAERVCDRAFVCGADGAVQVWNLNVEYRAGADAKRLCSVDVGKKISMAASGFDGDRAAVVTVDGTLHILRYSSAPQPSLSVECTIESFHSDGVGDVQFCPSGSRVYTRGNAGKDVFAWSTS